MAWSCNLEFWEPSQHLFIDTGKLRKTCVEVAGRRTFRILTSTQQSGIESNAPSLKSALYTPCVAKSLCVLRL